MADFLLELLSEEIPARMQVKAKADLERLFVDALAKAGLAASAIETFATPRRLALIAYGLPMQTEPVREETKGPKVGAPPQAIEGFLRTTALTQDQLVERDGIYFAVIDKPGRATAQVLAEAIPAIIRAFPWPKSMRWGASSQSTESLRWVRPLSGIVALLDDAIVPVEVDGIAAGRATMGHRFHSSGRVEIAGAGAYVEALRAAHVIVQYSDRCALIRDGARAAASAAGLTLVEDEGLVSENAGLTEWPVPLLGRFDPSFLAVPEEVIQLTARINQKYFICRDDAGRLAPAFVCTANIAASDGGAAIIAGNEKVLSARLSDAKFFWEADLKVPLKEQAEQLGRITFHEQLGTVADHVSRLRNMARVLLAETAGPNCDPQLAHRAAKLCKADLVTGSVGEFPELQGVMGGHIARAQGEDGAVADAIRDHYKPVGQGDDVPTAPVTVAVSLADKLVTIVGFLSRGVWPTGSQDPFALRRAALGVIALIRENEIRISLSRLVYGALRQTDRPEKVAQVVDLVLEPLPTEIHTIDRDFVARIVQFFIDRLKVQQREACVRHDLIDAVFGLGGEDDLVRLLARVKALQAFMETGDGGNLLAAYKRAANILKQAEPAGEVPCVVDMTDHEAALHDALAAAEPLAAAAVAEERFADAMAALATLRAPIDAFFDGVMVNDPDPALRAFRLGLLARFRDACHAVADFSQIEG